MKKAAYYFFVLSLFLFACSTEKFDGFTISGNIIKGAGKTVYLNQIQGNALLVVDSTKIDQQNNFTFKGKNPTTRFYIVSIVSGDRKVTENVQLLVAPQDQVVLGGTLDNDWKSNYTVSGSRESELIKSLNAALKRTTLSLDSIATLYRAAEEKNQVDSLQKANWDAANQKLKTDYRNLSLRTIQENDSSLVSIMALYQHLGVSETVFNIQQDFDLYQKTAQRMQQLYPESELVKSLTMAVTAQKLRATQQKTDARAVDIGTIAPEIVLPTPSGQNLALSTLKGKYVLLDFWAGWCKPCRDENPNLVATYAKYKKKGFTILQVSLDNDADLWKKAIKDDKLTWSHISDLQHWKSDAAKLYNVRTIPSNFLLDKDGRIIATNLRGDALPQKLEEIFKK